MHNADMPTMAASNYTSTGYALGAGGINQLYTTTTTTTPYQGYIGNSLNPQWLNQLNIVPQQTEFVQQLQELKHQAQVAKPKKEEVMSTAKRRLVQVFIADPNENVPLEQSVLYSGEQKLTDATDQELFFEIDIKGVLAAHNEKRINMIDKKVKERVEHLEPAKVRDLKMVVVTIAEF